MPNGSVFEDNIIFEVLNGKVHDRRNFDCGNESLNLFIAQYATQHQRNNLTVVYVATTRENTIPKPIYGFYTLSASDVSFNALTKDMIKNVPANYKIPSAKIGRLARNSKITTRGFGVALMVNAFGQVERLSKEVGIALIDIDAKNSKVASYYKRYGFVELLGYPHSLVIETATLSNILAMVLEDAVV